MWFWHRIRSVLNSASMGPSSRASFDWKRWSHLLSGNPHPHLHLQITLIIAWWLWLGWRKERFNIFSGYSGVFPFPRRIWGILPGWSSTWLIIQVGSTHHLKELDLDGAFVGNQFNEWGEVKKPYMFFPTWIRCAEPKWPLFLRVNPPKQDFFQSKTGVFGFQVGKYNLSMDDSWAFNRSTWGHVLIDDAPAPNARVHMPTWEHVPASAQQSRCDRGRKLQRDLFDSFFGWLRIRRISSKNDLIF